MQNELLKQIIILITFIFLILNPLITKSQELIRPLKQPQILLSGNFGELRATHFHAGIDFKTGGREGLPVLCVKDGYVARIKVSAVGYGQALYIEHADGTTTVYGHLQHYAPRIENIVKAIQYQKESFETDEDMKSYRLFFKQGDTIAYSGNSGSSGGPHLHFEVRDTKTEKLINPLRYYRIKDIIPPKVKKIYIYHISAKGCIDICQEKQAGLLSPGRYSCDKISVPAGKTGIGIFAEDYMNDSNSKLGIYRMEMIVRRDTLFRMKVDSNSFDQSPLINEIKDFSYYKKNETVYRCFGNYIDRVTGVKTKQHGYIDLPKDSIVPVEIVLYDINGNRSSVKFSLAASSAQSPPDPDNIMLYDTPYSIAANGFRLTLNSYSLFHSIEQNVYADHDSTGNITYILAKEETPLAKNARLDIEGDFNEKAVICGIDQRLKKYPKKTYRYEHGISCDINCLGRYIVQEDTIAPKISYLGISAGKQVQFKVKDNLTDITAYRGEVNGKWTLFVYDAKRELFLCSLSEPAFEKGKNNKIRFTAKDAVGNKGEITIDVKN